MQLTKFLVVILVLIARTSQADIVVTTANPDVPTSVLVEDTVKMVTSCFGNRIDAVGIVGDLPASLIWTLSVRYLIPATLLDNSNNITLGTKTKLVPGQFRHKLQVFIVGASSLRQLEVLIHRIIRPSIWWNHMASFFILDRSPECDNFDYFLLGAWHHGLLNAKVVCNRGNYGSYVVNYNPFTDKAPVSWQQIHTYNGRNNHPFTIFVWDYRANDAICAELDFAKTKDLGGYEIVVEGKVRGFQFRNKTFAGLSQLFAGRERLVRIIYRALNVIPKYTGLNRNKFPLNADMNIRYAPLGEITSVITYPHDRIGIVIITRFRGHKSQLEKILTVTDFDSRIGMVIVYLIMLMFFKFFVDQAVVPALLNLVRTTCNMGFSNLPNTVAPRMFLTGLLFYVVTMQGIYQGNLASLLTNVIQRKNVDSLDDLMNFGYTKIYGVDNMDRYIDHFDLKGRYIMVRDSADCIAHVTFDSSAACIDFAQGFVFDMARHNDLHLSSEFLAQEHVGFIIKRYWYAEEQINKILMRMVEADVVKSWKEKCNPTSLSDFKFDREVLKNTDYKILEFHEIRFAFVILGIGLTCASAVFIIEISARNLHRFLRRARLHLISHRDKFMATMREWKQASSRTHVREYCEDFRMTERRTIRKVRIKVTRK